MYVQAKGGGVAFIQRSSRELVAYVNGDHEYAIFNPNSQEEEETYERKFKDTMEQGTCMTWSKDHPFLYN